MICGALDRRSLLPCPGRIEVRTLTGHYTKEGARCAVCNRAIEFAELLALIDTLTAKTAEAYERGAQGAPRPGVVERIAAVTINEGPRLTDERRAEGLANFRRIVNSPEVRRDLERSAYTDELPRMPEAPSLSVVDGTAAWEAKDIEDLRARFEEAVREDDRIVIFSARRAVGMKIIVNANADTRSPPRVPWFEMLGFMQAKLNNWMREMLGD
jgi:hypothetical protein